MKKLKVITSIILMFAMCFEQNLHQIGTVHASETVSSNNTIDVEDIDIEEVLVDIELEDTEESSNDIISSQGNLEVSVSKNKAEISLDADNNNDFSVEIDDENLTVTGVENGEIIYANETEGYSVNAQILEGGARFMFELENVQSTDEFKIDMVLDEGDYIYTNELGESAVLDSEGSTKVLIGAPWAVDAEGNYVETSYEIVNNSLYQRINYEGDAYPVKADPLFCSDTINNSKTYAQSSTITGYNNYKAKGNTVYAVPQTCAKNYLVATTVVTIATGTLLSNIANSLVVKDMWSEVKEDGSYNYNNLIKNSKAGNGGMYDQFVCHAYIVVLKEYGKDSWNLDTQRIDVSLPTTAAYKCNPPVNKK